MSNTEERRGPGRPPKQREDFQPQPSDTASGGRLGTQVGEPKRIQQEEAEERDEQRRDIDEYNQAKANEDAMSATRAQELQQIEEDKKRKKGEKSVEVHLERDYRPADEIGEDGALRDSGDVGQKIPAGTTIRLPKAEAARALKLGIARATDRTFDD